MVSTVDWREWWSQDAMSHGVKDTCGNTYCAMYNGIECETKYISLYTLAKEFNFR